MNATLDRAELLRALTGLKVRRATQPIPLRVIANRDGLLLITPCQRDFVPAMVLVSGECLTSVGLLHAAVRIHRSKTLTFQADAEGFRFGAIRYAAINYRPTGEVPPDDAG